jgi:hypothetical protein
MTMKKSQIEITTQNTTIAVTEDSCYYTSASSKIEASTHLTLTSVAFTKSHRQILIERSCRFPLDDEIIC